MLLLAPESSTASPHALPVKIVKQTSVFSLYSDCVIYVSWELLLSGHFDAR